MYCDISQSTEIDEECQACAAAFNQAYCHVAFGGPRQLLDQPLDVAYAECFRGQVPSLLCCAFTPGTRMMIWLPQVCPGSGCPSCVVAVL